MKLLESDITTPSEIITDLTWKSILQHCCDYFSERYECWLGAYQ